MYRRGGKDAERLQAGLPIAVRCCWNGAAVMDAAPFLSGLRMRYPPHLRPSPEAVYALHRPMGSTCTCKCTMFLEPTLPLFASGVIADASIPTRTLFQTKPPLPYELSLLPCMRCGRCPIPCTAHPIPRASSHMIPPTPHASSHSGPPDSADHTRRASARHPSAPCSATI